MIKNNKYDENQASTKKTLFTQEEVNLMIKKRLDRARKKWEKEQNHQNNKLMYEQLKVKISKQFTELGMPLEWLDFLIIDDLKKPMSI